MRLPYHVLLVACCALAFFGTAVPAWAADDTHAVIAGTVVDAASGLPLSGVTVTAQGPSRKSATTDARGEFIIEGLAPGAYTLVAERNGYQGALSDMLLAKASGSVVVTLSLTRSAGGAPKLLAHTTVRATESLQRASVISQSVSAQAALKQGAIRGGDVLRTLPAIVNDASDTASPGDDVTLDIRGIGSLETTTLIDGHPTGAGIGGYDFEVSPIFGLKDIYVGYGSGGSDLYGVDAIGGVINMRTLDPTVQPQTTITQAYGTFDKLTTAIQSTGTTPDGKVGYALAFGTQGEDGPFHNARFFQPGAAFDQSAPVGSQVYNLGIYPDDASIANRSQLVKLQYHMSNSASLTGKILTSYWYDNKSGNGDNDYLPFGTALARANQLLANYTPPNPAPTPPFTASNPPACGPGTFLASNSVGAPNGFGPDGNPDGGIACQTPQQYAAFNAGWQGAGAAWQAFRNGDYSLKFESHRGISTLTVDGFTNHYDQTYDRTFSLPFTATYGDRAFWSNTAVNGSGVTLTDDLQAKSHDVGFGYSYTNDAFNFLSNGQPSGAPITHEQAFFVRDAFRPNDSRLTTYANVWFKRASITKTNVVDPRMSLVYTLPSDVIRIAAGATTTQPTAFDFAPFQPASIAAFQGGSPSCTGVNSIGTAPVDFIKPERGVDQELSIGHRFEGDSQLQLTFYNANVFDKIYSSTLPLTQTGLGSITQAQLQQFESYLAGLCGVTPSQTFPLLGVSGDFNLGETIARGIDISGRERFSRSFFIDYTYAASSSLLNNADLSIIQSNLTLIPGSQLPFVPLHTYSAAFDFASAKNEEARLSEFYVSANNGKNAPAYTYANLQLSAPFGRGTATMNVYNLFDQNAFYEGRIGEGYPHALNQYAQPSDYQPLIGTASTERLGLPFRTFELSYSVRVQ